MSKIILYSTHCPKCNILTKKLNDKKIKFEEVNDVDLMISKGFMSMPMLEVDGTVMNFLNANQWINEREGN
jgi:predicted thioredoxin/glutaredoxin